MLTGGTVQRDLPGRSDSKSVKFRPGSPARQPPTGPGAGRRRPGPPGPAPGSRRRTASLRASLSHRGNFGPESDAARWHHDHGIGRGSPRRRRRAGSLALQLKFRVKCQ